MLLNSVGTRTALSDAPLIPVPSTYNAPGVRHTAQIRAANWAGYVATGQKFTGVTGTWRVPSAVCTTADSFAAQWVGIDGHPSETVEQIGTGIACHDGVASYEAWYEMYGDADVNGGASVTLPSGYKVTAGDTVTGTVTVAGDMWSLTLADTSRGWSFTKNVTFHAEQASAEWIVERPDVCTSAEESSCQASTLTASKPVTFTAASAQAGGAMQPAATFAPAAATMVDVDSDATLASPSSLASTSFVVTIAGPDGVVVPASSQAPSCSSAPFTDVSKTNAFCGAISWLKTSGITTGYAGGAFRPGASISRAAVAAFLYRLAHDGAQAPSCSSAPFTDVSKTNAFCGAISWLKTSGITTGYAGGAFHPGASISRAAVAAFLYRLVALAGQAN
ncbi:MAG TPA: G1 family glutamic endopeptidase [Microbacteriaceae bacterium]|nr:G1 family glutamic endopeptidase [Microbacteriaceae bacterium]